MFSNLNQKVVYFAAPIRGNRVLIKIIRELFSFLKKRGIKILTEHIVADDPIQTLATKIGKTKKTLTAEDIEKQDIAWLDEANFVIAEISGASTGVGREIEYARVKEFFGKNPAKILCLYHKLKEFNASPMIRGMDLIRYPNIQVKSYNNNEEAKCLIVNFLKGKGK